MIFRCQDLTQDLTRSRRQKPDSYTFSASLQWTIFSNLLRVNKKSAFGFDTHLFKKHLRGKISYSGPR